MSALVHTRERLAERACAVWTPEHELTVAVSRSGACMQRTLGWHDLLSLGVGGMVGAGIFVTAGIAANRHAGPAVILSFVIAGVSALLSAFCYTEFAVEVPAAGGAFSYLRVSLGEFAAYLTGANLILEYVISNAAVARTFTSYLATVFGYGASAWLVEVPGIPQTFNQLDFPALALIFLLTICICRSTKHSSGFNLAMTFIHVALILFIVFVGFLNGDSKNLSKPGNPLSPAGFAPFGARGVLDGAAIVYMSFIGYDAVSTMAEEVKEPSRNMRIGISGSVFIVTVLYCMMAAAMVMLAPYDQVPVETLNLLIVFVCMDGLSVVVTPVVLLVHIILQIDPKAAFSMVFKVDGWSWASILVGIGACFGILTSLMVALLGQARYLCVIGRSGLIPCWFSKVDESSGTPVHSSIFLGICTAGVALFMDLPFLTDLISIGTLFVFYMVANALIFRRHVVIGVTNAWPTIAFLGGITGLSLGSAIFWRSEGDICKFGMAFCAGAFVVSAVTFWVFVPTAQRSKRCEAPFMPWLAVVSIFVNVFLAGSLNRQAYTRFGAWSIVAVLFYVLYSVHSTHDVEGGFLCNFHLATDREDQQHSAQLLSSETKTSDAL